MDTMEQMNERENHIPAEYQEDTIDLLELFFCFAGSLESNDSGYGTMWMSGRSI